MEGVGSLQVFRGGIRHCASGSGEAGVLLADAVRRAERGETQNVRVSAGKIGALPSSNAQQLTATVRAQSRACRRSISLKTSS